MFASINAPHRQNVTVLFTDGGPNRALLVAQVTFKRDALHESRSLFRAGRRYS